MDTVYRKKNYAKLFCQNFVKFSPAVIIFCAKMHSFSTPLNLRQCTTVLNAFGGNLTTFWQNVCTVFFLGTRCTSFCNVLVPAFAFLNTPLPFFRRSL